MILGVALLISSACADEVKVFGDKIIEQGMVVTGDVIAVTGNLIVRGTVNGSAVAYVGDVILDSTAVVDGNVVARRGRIIQSPGSKVSGDLVEGRLPGLKIGRDEEAPLAFRGVKAEISVSDSHEREKDRRGRRDHEIKVGMEGKLSYNKVDGLFIGLSMDEIPFSDYGVHFRTFGWGGYAFSSHSWQGQGGFGFGFLPRGQLELSLDAFYQTYTEDAWYMSDGENSPAAFFFHEDFRDYYLREGFGTTLAWQPIKPLNFSVRYQAEQQTGLDNATNWALFGPRKNFTPNLLIQEGMLREFVLGAGYDNRDDAKAPFQGWKLSAETELTDPGLKSDFDYNRYVLDGRRYQPLTRFINLDNRVRLGNSDGTLPPQKRFYLGGPSSLQGYSLKEFSGREFALWNAELRLHDERHRGRGFLRHLGLIFISDLGLASDQPLGNFRTSDWKHDAGVALSNHSGTVRLQVARRTDTSHDPYVWLFRIQRPF
jgi:cytoskeletal protein CcmA (bactofilin family)